MVEIVLHSPYLIKVRRRHLNDYNIIEVFFDKKYIDLFLRQGFWKYREVIKTLCNEDKYVDVYIGTPEEYAVKTFANTILRRLLYKKLNTHIPEFQVTEETDYGIPEYSLYWNYDARSWCGKWTWNNIRLLDVETELCFGFCRNDREIDEIGNIAIRGLEEAEKQGLQYIFAFYLNDP